jgi:hypothetical protein
MLNTCSRFCRLIARAPVASKIEVVLYAQIGKTQGLPARE